MNLLILLLLLSCSQAKPVKPYDKDLVDVRTALDQAQMSYLRACVEAFQDMKMAPSFDSCREKAITHRLELDSIMGTVPVPLVVPRD